MKSAIIMDMIYLDNAATSFPKAEGVAESIFSYIKENGRNIYRTNSMKSYDTVNQLIDLRIDISSLAGHADESTLFLNSGLTESINTVLRGYLKRNDHVIISHSEHNAVMRTLSDIGVSYSYPRVTGDGRNILDDIPHLLRENTKAIVFNISSNVTGVNEDTEKLACISNDLGVPLIIDTAQAFPFSEIKMDERNIMAMCFSGHKGLLGPEGTGGFILQKEFLGKVKPLITGGTGSRSDSIVQPEIYPDRFESGTRNIPGLIGLSAAARYVKEHLEELRKREKENTLYLLEGLLRIDGIKVHGELKEDRNSVISITAEEMDNAILAERLLEKYGIETRVGLHCAALAHKAIGTFPEGTIRLSPSPFTSKDELDAALDAIRREMR